MGVPPNIPKWNILENPTNMDDLGETPYIKGKKGQLSSWNAMGFFS